MYYTMSPENMYNDYLQVKRLMKNKLSHFAILKLAITGDEHLQNKYIQHITDHNNNVLNNEYVDSGFDLFVPEDVIFSQPFDVSMIDFQIKCEMIYCDTKDDILDPTAFTVHPRSSISKTPLMLANHTGIIDSGYRGSLKGAFRSLPFSQNNDSNIYVVAQFTRLLQICHPTLCPVYVYIVAETDLASSERGTGGFGSTGK